MKRILGALVCGLMIVGLVGLPGSAHHSRDERRLTKRVARLERVVDDQGLRIRNLNDALNDAEERIEGLISQTLQLDDEGNYTGEISNRQVVVPLSICQHLDDAVFGDDPNDGRDVAYLGCVRGSR